ncbi:MAG: flavodoxin/nitric oxide [Bacteroidetes bacterium]|nr:MAG: flavodoxin/nitric oxide [Bacteroidota bacterium]
MKALIIYESAFGNTELIAFAIRDVLNQSCETIALHPDKIQPADLQNYDLIIAGSPTQKFSPLPQIAAFISKLPSGSLKGKNVAAFDTRIDLMKQNNRFLSFMVWLFGYAAEPLAKKLKSKKGNLIVPAEGFFVDDTKGPISEGELKRAKEWAENLIIRQTQIH